MKGNTKGTIHLDILNSVSAEDRLPGRLARTFKTMNDAMYNIRTAQLNTSVTVRRRSRLCDGNVIVLG